MSSHLWGDLLTVRADEAAGALVVLDQTRLPNEEVYLHLRTLEEVREAICRLRVRGAPAIGIAAAYGLSLCLQNTEAASFADFHTELKRISARLESARPTAVNLAAALQRMERALLQARERPGTADTPAEWKRILREEARAIREEDAAACRAIGRHGLSLLQPGWSLLTHCNAGHLAVSEYGTALAPVYAGHERGYGFRVYADETRPLLQGARLTAYELQRAGVDVTLICDNMVCSLMRQGKIQAVLVGCDRIAANGDTANKIGTSGVALMARHFGIPFYVLGPVSTLDFACPDGGAIRIEERAPEEVTELGFSRRMAPEGVKVYNPAFDVTPAEWITAIVTERGVARPPFTGSLAAWKSE